MHLLRNEWLRISHFVVILFLNDQEFVLENMQKRIKTAIGRSSLTNEKDHHYFSNRIVCVDVFFDG